MFVKIVFSALIIFSTFAYSNDSSKFDETIIQAPFIDSNSESLSPRTCTTHESERWDHCFIDSINGEEKMISFNFTNWGENRIVPKSGFGIGREFEFLFEGYARSDLG